MNYVHVRPLAGKILRPLALAGLLCAASAAQGAVSLSITDGVGDPHAISLTSGETFNLTISVIAQNSISGISYYLNAPGPGAGKFQITGRQNVGTVFSDWVTLPPQFTDVVLAETPSKDLGAEVPLGNPNVVPGTYFLANFTVSTAGIAPGIYTIVADRNLSMAMDNDFNVYDDVNSNTYTVTVVPEPGTAALTLGGLGLLGLRRRRVA